MSPPPRYSLLATRLLLVAKTDPDMPPGQDDPAVPRDQLVPADDFRERHAQDVGRPVHHAGAEVLCGEGAHRGGAESEREQAIEGGGRAPALEMAEHQAPRLLAGPPPDLVRHLLRNPAEPLRRAGPGLLAQHRPPPLGPRPFGRHHDGEAPAALLPLLDLLAHLVDVEGDFGNQDDVGASGKPAVQRDPARVPPHELNDEDPVVALGGAVDLVERVGRSADRGVEAEGGFGAGHVVVDGLGHPDDGDPLAEEPVRDGQAPVAADRHEGVEMVLVEGVDQVLAAVVLDDPAVAVSTPKVDSGPDTSLSMVLGTPTTGTPLQKSRCAMARLPSPPIATRASRWCSWKAWIRSSERSSWMIPPSRCRVGQWNGSPRLVVPRMVPPRWVMPRTSSGPRRFSPSPEPPRRRSGPVHRSPLRSFRGKSPS